MEIYERLRGTREDLDLTQEQIANAANCSRRQYIRYENGEQEMTISRLREICLYMNVSADYLLGLPKGLHWPR